MEFEDYLRVLRSHWIAIAVITALCAALAYGWTLTQPRVYTANASAIITTGVSEDLGQALVGDNYAKSRVKSYVDIATSRRVAEYAAEELGLTASPESLVGRVSVSNPLDTAVLRISASAGSPQEAKDLAEAWIQGMILAVDVLENDVDSASQLPGGGDSVVALRTLDSAVLPGAPSSPNTRLAVALGVLVGLVLGVTYALIRNALDRRLRTAAAVEREFDLPVVGTIPHDPSIAKGGPTRGGADFGTREAVRQLRTNLQFMDVDHPPRIIVVTSALPGDGKSTVTIQLAEAIAQSGQPVVVVDADLRRPTIAQTLGLIPGVGLTDVLVGRATVDDVVQPYGDSGALLVLGAGQVPPNPSELLGSDTMQHLLRGLPQDAIVLIDTPPLIPVTDAAILTARTDGALVVARAGKTTVEVLDKALQNLDRVKGRALGVILDGVRRRDGGEGYYGAEYRYESSDAVSARTKAARRSG